MGFGKFVIRLFIIKLIWFGVELLLIFMGWSFIKRFLAWTDSSMRGYIYIFRIKHTKDDKSNKGDALKASQIN